MVCWQAGAAFLFLISGKAHAQDAVRSSLASEEAASLQKKADDLEYYNLKMGRVNVRFQAQLESGFIDNVNYTEQNRISDFYFKPNATIQASWPITPGNSLLLATDIGYTKYVKTTSNDHLDISPNSTLNYRLYTGDFVINLHDRFSVSQDVAETPTVSGSGNINQLENTAGVGVDWDLNKLIISFGYDHDWTEYPGSIFDYSDHNSDLFNAKAAYAINPTTTAGLEVGAGLTYYSQTAFSDNDHVSLGAFYQTKLTEHIQLKAKLGGVIYTFFSNPHPIGIIAAPGSPALTTNTPPASVEGWYGDLTLTHNVNRWFDQSLSAGHEFTVATAADLLDLYYVHYQANWHFFRNVPVAVPLFFEKGKSFGGTAESFNRYGAGVNVSYLITKKFTSAAKYDFIDKNSNIGGNDYIENQLVLDFSYSF